MSFCLFRFICMIAISLLTLSSVGRADLVALIPNGPPWFFEDEDQQGVQERFFQHLGELSGISISIQKAEPSEFIDHLKQGQVDLVISPRNVDLRYHAVPLVRLGEIDQIVVPAKDSWILGYDDLQDKVIARIHGVALQPYFDQDDSLNIKTVQSLGQAIEMLGRGEVDAVAGAAPVLLFHLNRTGGYDPDRQFPYRLQITPLWLQQSMNRLIPLEDLELLLLAARQMAQDGTLLELIDQVVGQARHHRN